MSLTHYVALVDFKFNGRDYRRGDPVPRSAIVEVAPEKEGSLYRTRFIGDPPDRRLEDMSVAELRDHARTVGVTGQLPRTKKDLIAEIEGVVHGS